MRTRVHTTLITLDSKAKLRAVSSFFVRASLSLFVASKRLIKDSFLDWVA